MDFCFDRVSNVASNQLMENFTGGEFAGWLVAEDWDYPLAFSIQQWHYGRNMFGVFRSYSIKLDRNLVESFPLNEYYNFLVEIENPYNQS